MQIEDLYNKDKKKVPPAGTGDIKILHKVGTGTKKLNIQNSMIDKKKI